MEEIIENPEDLTTSVTQLFHPNGRLTRALPGFVARQAQIEMAFAVEKAIEGHQTLVVEAGTGTGKTYAYLVPSLLSRKRIILSTATKTLQDQLVEKDLPTLIRALGLSVRVQNLKGRANYICRYRVQLFFEEGRFNHPKIAHDMTTIHQALPRLQSGERGELVEIEEDAAVWPYVTSTPDNCLGSDCEQYQDCFLVKARRRAMEADVVVINHHLFFADSKLKDEGFGEILPQAKVVIFDEAHQLLDVASMFSGERLSTRQIKDLVDDMIREWPAIDLANQSLQDKTRELDTLLDHLYLSLPGREDKMMWQLAKNSPQFKEKWQALIDFCEDLLQCFSALTQEMSTGVSRCKTRLEELLVFFNDFESAQQDFIQWVERYKQTLGFFKTPIVIAENFQAHLNRENCAYLFTSATLALGQSFDAFLNPLGLKDVQTLYLGSPFDYQHQALLYLPRGLPDPKSERYYDALLEKVVPIIKACGGRTFFLFTSYKALHYVASRLGHIIQYPILIQGDEAKPILLARFREAGNAVLLGTATFWEGVDVKGEALSCVIIDKLPFASPQDPLMKGKMAHIEKQGLSSFNELTLPEAVIALKQGVGRLIRDTRDRGVLVIADPRLTAREYGRVIFESLPPIPKTRDENSVLTFIDQLALYDEVISN